MNAAPPRVLVIDGSEDSREVLQTVLQHRGVTTVTATSRQSGLQSAQTLHPEVLVVDLESLADGESVWEPWLMIAKTQGTQVIFVTEHPETALPPKVCHRIRKPYHFGNLLHKIEGLLGEHKLSANSCGLQSELGRRAA